MSQPPTKKYPAAFKERAVKPAVESDQPIAQTAHDLGVNENTLHTWIGKYHRAERQEQQFQDEHLYDELKRLRKENARLKEERDILKRSYWIPGSYAPALSEKHNAFLRPLKNKGFKEESGAKFGLDAISMSTTLEADKSLVILGFPLFRALLLPDGLEGLMFTLWAQRHMAWCGLRFGT
jgi:transposase